MLFDVSNLVKELFDISLSDDELSSLEDYKTIINSRVPDSKILASDRSASALTIKSDISYLYYSVRNLGLNLQVKHDDSYNKKFAALSRLGRPSKAAIESEIYSSDSSLRELKSKLDKYNLLVQYLESVIAILDGYIYMLNNRAFAL